MADEKSTKKPDGTKPQEADLQDLPTASVKGDDAHVKGGKGEQKKWVPAVQ